MLSGTPIDCEYSGIGQNINNQFKGILISVGLDIQNSGLVKFVMDGNMQKVIERILLSELPDLYYEFGFADLKGLLPPDYKDFQSGIAIIRKLDDEIIDSIYGGPTLEYYNHYNDINRELNTCIDKICSLLKTEGISSRGIQSTVEDSELGDEYFQTLRLDFSHKMAATRAGLGWIGKTALFVSKRFGPRVRLASILIGVPVIPANEPVEESMCGSCSVCVDCCPAKAASGRLWNVNIDRNEFFDPFKCRENNRRLSRKNFGKDISLCGICVSVCPRGRK